MGLFDELDMDNVPDDPNFVPNATYSAVLTNIKPQASKKDQRKYLIFTYRIDEGDFAGTEVTEWKNVDPKATPKELSWVKQRIISLGVPESRASSVEADDLIGTACKITTKMNNGFCNINKVVVDSGLDTVSDDSGGFSDSM